MLNRKQARYISRANRLKVFFNKNSKLISSYKPVDRLVTDFLASLTGIEDELPEKDVKGKGETGAKDALKMKIAEESSDICRIAKSYAMAANNADLSAAMGCCYSDVVKMKDTELLGWITKQYNLLQPLTGDETFAEYGITQEMLDDVVTDAQAFNDALGKAAVTDFNSNMANDNIDKALNSMNENLNQLELLMPYFKKKHPQFVESFGMNKKLNDAGVKHSGVTGKLTKKGTEEPLEKGTVRLADTNKETKISLTGKYEIIKVKTGHYKLEIVVNDVVVASKVIHIARGKVMELNMAV